MSRIFSPLCLAVGIGLIATSASPVPNEILYVANYSGGKIVRVDEQGNALTIISGLRDLASLLALPRLNGETGVVACADRVILYENVIDQGSQPGSVSPAFNFIGVTIANLRCNGITRDPNGNIFFVHARVADAPGGAPRQVWMIPIGGSGPGGYRPPVLIDQNVNADTLEHAVIVRTDTGRLEREDLLVLAGGKKNARLILYRKEGGEYQKLDDSFIPFPDNDQPKGVAFVGGRLLVSLVGGTIKTFDGEGAERPAFATGLGGSLWKIEAGSQGGIYRLFAAHRGTHTVLSIDVAFNQGNPVAGQIGTLRQGFGFPQDVAIPQDIMFIPAQESFTGAFNAQDVTLRNPRGGTADLTCGFTRVDPRESECPGRCSGECVDDFCQRDLDAVEVGLPYPGVKFPGQVRSLKVGHPQEGEPKFFACVGRAPDFGLAEHLVHEDEFLDWEDPNPPEPDCADPDTSRRATFFRGTIPGLDPPVVEGNRLVPYPTGCVPESSNRGDIDDYSVILPAARLLLPFCQVVDDGLANLLGTLNALSDFIDDPVEGQLRELRAAAAQAFLQYKGGDPAAQKVAQATLEAFVRNVEANPESFNNAKAGRNVSGEVNVRARSAGYLIGQVTLPVPGVCQP